MKVSRQFDDFHVGTQAFSQGGRAVGNNGKVLIKKRRAEDVLLSLTSPMNELANIGDRHAKIVAFVGTPPKDFVRTPPRRLDSLEPRPEALEAAARRHALGLAARAIQQRLNSDYSDAIQTHHIAPCGGVARFAGRRTKTFNSILGPFELKRAHHHCPARGYCFFPRDRHLGIEDTSLGRLPDSAAGAAPSRRPLRRGRCTSSGVVEAGCKVAIGIRLKRAGMHWTVQGSNAIIALRCSKLSRRLQDLWGRLAGHAETLEAATQRGGSARQEVDHKDRATNFLRVFSVIGAAAV